MGHVILWPSATANAHSYKCDHTCRYYPCICRILALALSMNAIAVSHACKNAYKCTDGGVYESS